MLCASGDIYFLGVVLYRLLTRHLPFEAESNYGLSRKTLNGEAPSIRSLRPCFCRHLSISRRR